MGRVRPARPDREGLGFSGALWATTDLTTTAPSPGKKKVLLYPQTRRGGSVHTSLGRIWKTRRQGPREKGEGGIHPPQETQRSLWSRTRRDRYPQPEYLPILLGWAPILEQRWVPLLHLPRGPLLARDARAGTRSEPRGTPTCPHPAGPLPQDGPGLGAASRLGGLSLGSQELMSASLPVPLPSSLPQATCSGPLCLHFSFCTA